VAFCIVRPRVVRQNIPTTHSTRVRTRPPLTKGLDPRAPHPVLRLLVPAHFVPTLPQFRASAVQSMCRCSICLSFTSLFRCAFHVFHACHPFLCNPFYLFWSSKAPLLFRGANCSPEPKKRVMYPLTSGIKTLQRPAGPPAWSFSCRMRQ